MRRNKIFATILLASAALLAACSHDELAEQSTMLPEGAYPLQIGSVTIDAQSSERPWTRVAENSTGEGSLWETGDIIHIRMSDNTKTGVYAMGVSGFFSLNEIYWKSTQPATVTAWYSNIAGSATVSTNTVSLADQSSRLAYVLKGSGTGSHTAAVNLAFTHQLAKVRVLPRGTQDVSTITNIYVQGPTSCTVSEGNVTAGTEISRIKMQQANYDGIGTCWEANLPAGATIDKFFIEIDNNVFDCAVTEFTTEAGQIHEVKLKVHSADTEFVDLSTLTGTYTISDDTKPYYFTGTSTYGISITGGSPEIYLDNANVTNSTGSAISITGNATPTIHVVGAGNIVSSSNGAGIYVAQNATVTIQGNSTEDALTCEGNNLSAGIGGYMIDNNTAYKCGNIVIDNVTLTARSGQRANVGNYAAGIGAAANASVGSISISNAIIYADGGGDNINMGAAAIGGGIDCVYLSGQTEFDITISNSTIHTTRGCSYASYIGAGGWNGGAARYNIISTANITDCIIYNESGTEITQ